MSGASGRWPANVILTHHPDCVCVGSRKVKPLEGHRPNPVAEQADGQLQFNQKAPGYQKTSYTAPDGTETVEDWDCHPDCPVRMLDEQSGEAGIHGAGKPRTHHEGTHAGNRIEGWGNMGAPAMRFGDTGGASRFFYVAKASRSDRNRGLLDFLPRCRSARKRRQQDIAGTFAARARNRHPTVKPLALMQYLCRLVTPPGGLVLDPFAGSGSTLVAAVQEGFGTVGIEQTRADVEIARARVAAAMYVPSAGPLFEGDQ